MPFYPGFWHSGAVPFDFTKTDVGVRADDPSSPHTFTGLSIGDEISTRAVVVTVHAHNGDTDNAPTFTSVTIGGESAVEVSTATDSNAGLGANNSVRQSIFIAVVPTGTTADIVVSWSGNINRMQVVAHRMVGYESTTPADTAETANGAAVTIDCPAGGVVLGGAVANPDSATTHTWVGLTEDEDVDDSGFSWSTAWDIFPTTQTDLSISANCSDDIDNEAMAAASWAPA